MCGLMQRVFSFRNWLLLKKPTSDLVIATRRLPIQGATGSSITEVPGCLDPSRALQGPTEPPGGIDALSSQRMPPCKCATASSQAGKIENMLVNPATSKTS